MRISTIFISSLFSAIALLGCGAENAAKSDASEAAGISGKTVVSHGRASIGGPFTLLDDKGEQVTESDLLGKPHLIYFGFAYCPDICPTALQKLGTAQQLMGKAGDDIGYVLITVDPERDTVEKISQYVSFDPFPSGLRGFTGSVAQIDAAKAAYKVVTTKSDFEGGPVEEGAEDYTVNHSDIIYLMGSDGKFADFFSSRSTPRDIAVRVGQELMKSDK